MPFAPNIVFRMRWMIGIALLAIAAIVPATIARSGAELPATGSAPVAAAPLPSLTPALADLAVSKPGKRVEVIVQMTQGTKRSAATPLVTELGGRVTRDLHIINAVVAKLPAAGARELAAAAERARGLAQRRDQAAGAGRQALHELQPVDPGAVPLEHYRGTGRGVGVAVIDTGIAGEPARLPRLHRRQALARHRLGGRQPGRHHGQRPLRPRHARRRHHRRRLRGPRPRRLEEGPLLRRRAGRQPRLDQGLRRRGQHQRPRRDRRHPVRHGSQGRIQHPRHQPVARVDGRRVLQDRPARRRRRGRLVRRHLRRRRRRQPRPGRRRRSATRPATTPTSSPSAPSTTRARRRSATTCRRPGRAAARRRTASASPTSTRRAPRSSRPSRRAASTAKLCESCVSEDGEYIRAGGTSMAAPMVAGAAAIGFQLAAEPHAGPHQGAAAGLRPPADGRRSTSSAWSTPPAASPPTAAGSRTRA